MPRSLVGVVSATRAGTARDVLVAMQHLIAKQLDEGVAARDLAPLTKRLMEIQKEIEVFDAVSNSDAVGAAAATPDAPWSAA